MATTKTFISSVGAKSQGRYSYYKMLSEARQGDLVKVKRGVYQSFHRPFMWLSRREER